MKAGPSSSQLGSLRRLGGWPLLVAGGVVIVVLSVGARRGPSPPGSLWWELFPEGTSWTEVGLNVAFYVPFGAGVGWLTGRVTVAATAAAAVSIVLEILQAAALSGRMGTLQDVLANVVGATGGAALVVLTERWSRRNRYAFWAALVLWGGAVAAIVVAAGLLLALVAGAPLAPR